MRSLGASAFAEALDSFIAILMMKANALPLSSILEIALVTYAIKISYSIVFAGPANLLVNYLKRITEIDVYESEKYKIMEYLRGNRYRISNQYFEKIYSGDNICKSAEMFNNIEAADLCKIAHNTGFLEARKLSSKIKEAVESRIEDYSGYKNVIKLERNN